MNYEEILHNVGNIGFHTQYATDPNITSWTHSGPLDMDLQL